MSYIRGETYIWHDDLDVHIWGRKDYRKDNGNDKSFGSNYESGVIIPVDDWERVVAAILTETFPGRDRLWIKAVMAERKERQRLQHDLRCGD